MTSFLRNVMATLMGLLVAAFTFSASAEPVPRATVAMTELITTHDAILKSMNVPRADGELLPVGDARISQLLAQGWQLTERWASAWLDLHANPSEKDLDGLFEEFSSPPHDPAVYDSKLPAKYAMAGSATRIAKEVYVVKAFYEESQSANGASTFFIVARKGEGHFETKWSIRPIAAAHYSRRDEIGRWAFLGSCAYYCGPLMVQEVLPLPSSEGRPRFLIDAYQATNGSTLVKQVSVWQWDGERAKNLAIRSYMLYVDDNRKIQVTGDSLVVPTKETAKTFGSYGCCAEPRGTWTLLLRPEGVRDLGDKFLQPQIQWADRMLTAVMNKRPVAANLASPSVVAYIRHAEIEMGSVDKCEVLSSGKEGSFEILLGSGSRLSFTYRLRNGQPYFTRVQVE